MNKHAWLSLLLAACVLLGVTACRKESSTTANGTVKASKAYLVHFGDPPAPKEGKGFARVGFFSRKDAPGKVTAMPFFLFRESDQLPLLLDRLVTTKAADLARSPLLNPFPPGSSVRVVSQEGGTVTLELLLQESPPADAVAAMAASLVETATQFEGIVKVRIVRDGAPLPGMPEGGFMHDAERIEAPGSPTLLLVVAAWDEGAQGPEEILADFDRPVTIEHFRLQDASGQEIQGDYFTSAFDMAVVIRPQNPSALREGMPLHAAWRVVDPLGRRGEGAGAYTLERRDHAE